MKGQSIFSAQNTFLSLFFFILLNYLQATCEFLYLLLIKWILYIFNNNNDSNNNNNIVQ